MTATTADIAPELAHLAVPIDSVQPHPDNPRRGDVDRIAMSIRAHGQRQPILVQKATGYIVAGSHRWQAMKKLGFTHVAALVMAMPDDRARAYMAVDNRTSDLGTYDDPALLELLQGLQVSDPGLAGTGYDNTDVDDLLARLAGTDELPDLAKPQRSRFDASATRAVMLSYPMERFRWVVAKLGEIGDELGTDSHADTLVALIAAETERDAPA